MPTDTERVKHICKLAMKEFGRSGFQLIEKPARQLFTHTATGQLVARDDITQNQKVLAKLALEFPFCSDQYNLRQSLRASAQGNSLLFSSGCKVVFGIQFSGETAEVVSLGITLNFKPNVMEARHLRAIDDAEVAVPANTIFLELICAKPKTGAATFLLLALLSKLSQKDAILTNPTNLRARLLFQRHGYEEFAGRQDLAILRRRVAAENGDRYFEMLPGYAETVRLCTRAGIRDPSKTYWDCR